MPDESEDTKMHSYHDPCPTVALGSEAELNGGIRIRRKEQTEHSVTIMLRDAVRKKLPAIYEKGRRVLMPDIANCDAIGQQQIEAFRASKELHFMMEEMARREGIDKMNVGVFWEELSLAEQHNYTKCLHNERHKGVLGCRNPKGVIRATAGAVVHIQMRETYERLRSEVGALAAASAFARLWRSCEALYPTFNALTAINFASFQHWMGESNEAFMIEEYRDEMAHERGVEPEEVTREEIVDCYDLVTREMIAETYDEGFIAVWEGARQQGSVSSDLYDTIVDLTESVRPVADRLSSLCVTSESEEWNTHYLMESIGAICHVETEGADDLTSRMCDDYVEMRYQYGDCDGGVFQQGVEATKDSVENAADAIITYMEGLGLVKEALQVISDEEPHYGQAYFGGPLKPQPATFYLPVQISITPDEAREGGKIGNAILSGLRTDRGGLRTPEIGAEAML